MSKEDGPARYPDDRELQRLQSAWTWWSSRLQKEEIFVSPAVGRGPRRGFPLRSGRAMMPTLCGRPRPPQPPNRTGKVEN